MQHSFPELVVPLNKFPTAVILLPEPPEGFRTFPMLVMRLKNVLLS